MRVKMLEHITGSRNGVRWPAAGGVVDLPANEAEELIAGGRAELDESVEAPDAALDVDEAPATQEVDDEPVEAEEPVEEPREAPQPETRPARRPNKRRR